VKVNSMNDFTLLLPDATKLILQHVAIEPDSHQVMLTIATSQADCACPKCQTVSHRVHSHYPRQIADLPWSDYTVALQLQSRKLFCDNPACAQKVFTERLPHIVQPWGRCTLRLNDCLSQLGVMVGGQAGAKLSQDCHCRRSRNTLLRRVMALPLPAITTPKTVGVDDFAFRKGSRYGTIIVDLDQHRPIALLPDREAKTVADWLRDHPGIEVLSRDRSKTYKQAMDMGAPEAIQVADRFHLLHNLEELLESCLSGQKAALQAVEAAYYGQVSLPPPLPSLRQQKRQASRERRYENYQQTHQLRQAGQTITAIAQALGIGKRTVYTYLSQPMFLERQPHPRQGRQAVIAPYTDYLIQRWSEGIKQGQQLFQEIQQQGYSGGYASVMRFLQPLQGKTSQDAASLSIPEIRARLQQKALTARRAAWLVMTKTDNLTETEKQLRQLMAHQSDLAKMVQLSQSFLELVRERQVDQFDDWLVAATESDMVEFQRFATGLKADYQAVKAALELDVSNGPVEGLNNRLKMLKRQMYGRASLDLLTHRFLLSA
jgi:transposase